MDDIESDQHNEPLAEDCGRASSRMDVDGQLQLDAPLMPDVITCTTQVEDFGLISSGKDVEDQPRLDAQLMADDITRTLQDDHNEHVREKKKRKLVRKSSSAAPVDGSADGGVLRPKNKRKPKTYD